MQRVLLVPLSVLLSLSGPLWARSVDVKSPDGDIIVSVSDDDNVLTYRIIFEGEEAVAPSNLGMALKYGDTLDLNFAACGGSAIRVKAVE